MMERKRIFDETYKSWTAGEAHAGIIITFGLSEYTGISRFWNPKLDELKFQLPSIELSLSLRGLPLTALIFYRAG